MLQVVYYSSSTLLYIHFDSYFQERRVVLTAVSLILQICTPLAWPQELRYVAIFLGAELLLICFRPSIRDFGEQLK